MVRWLVINADDFGLSAGVNRGVIETFEHGVVTSASLMVRQPAAAAAADYARANPRLGLGLHVDLWESVFEDGQWVKRYAWAAEEPQAVEHEIRAQLARFRALVGRDPDHLDSHQHVQRKDAVHEPFMRVAAELGVPVRGAAPWRYLGGFYGQDDVGGPHLEGVSVQRLVELIDALGPGCTEFGCHPAVVEGDDELAQATYRFERDLERRTLCDPRVRERLSRGDVVLGTYASVSAAAAWRAAG